MEDQRELDLNTFYAKKIRRLKSTIIAFKKEQRVNQSLLKKQKASLTLLRNQKEAIESQRNRIVKSIERICPESACLPAKTIASSSTPSVWRTRVQPTQVDFDPSPNISPQELCEVEELLYKVEIGAYDLPNLRRGIHLKVNNIENGEVCYYVSRSALRDLMSLSYPLEYITKEIALKMVERLTSTSSRPKESYRREMKWMNKQN